MDGGRQLDVASLHARHPAFQIRAAAGGGEPPVWSARPWAGDGTGWWDGTGAAATAGTAGELDELLAKLEAGG